MIWTIAGAWAAPPMAVVLGVPATRIRHDQPETECLRVRGVFPVAPTDADLFEFRTTCTVGRGWLQVCVTLLAPEWPRHIPTLQCGRDGSAVMVRPVKAYHPTEDIWDGVAVLQDVTAEIAGKYVVDHPDVPGLMDRGLCGIQDGLFQFVTASREPQQRCTLVMEDGSERVIPIRLVSRLRRMGR